MQEPCVLLCPLGPSTRVSWRMGMPRGSGAETIRYLAFVPASDGASRTRGRELGGRVGDSLIGAGRGMPCLWLVDTLHVLGSVFVDQRDASIASVLGYGLRAT